jgi:hypothetical protein
MLTDKFSKSDAARETFIATAISVFFIVIALLLYLM